MNVQMVDYNDEDHVWQRERETLKRRRAELKRERDEERKITRTLLFADMYPEESQVPERQTTEQEELALRYKLRARGKLVYYRRILRGEVRFSPRHPVLPAVFLQDFERRVRLQMKRGDGGVGRTCQSTFEEFFVEGWRVKPSVYERALDSM